MRRLGFYLFRQHTTAFLFATGAVTFVVLFTQLFRLLSLVIDNSSTMLIFFNLIGLSIPTFLPLVLPLGLGAATLFTYHKLAVDSELVVMRAAGVSTMRMAAPAFLMMIIIMLFCYTLTLWLTPAAHRNLVSLQYKVRDSYAVFLSHPSSFNDITDSLTFYARRRGANGALEGILIQDQRQPLAPVTIMADTGQVVDNNGAPQIVIYKGERQEMNMTTGKVDELAFDQYVLDLNSLRSASPDRLPEPRELTLGDLLNPPAAILKGRTREFMFSELHQRLASPLLALSYGMIGLAAILAGEFNRRGMGRRVMIAGSTIVVTQACFMAMIGMVAHHVWFAPGLYLTALIPAAISMAMLNMEAVYGYIADFKAWLPRRVTAAP